MAATSESVMSAVDKDCLWFVAKQLVDLLIGSGDFQFALARLVEQRRGANLRSIDLRLVSKAEYLQILIDEVVAGICTEIGTSREEIQAQIFAEARSTRVSGSCSF